MPFSIHISIQFQLVFEKNDQGQIGNRFLKNFFFQPNVPFGFRNGVFTNPQNERTLRKSHHQSMKRNQNQRLNSAKSHSNNNNSSSYHVMDESIGTTESLIDLARASFRVSITF